MKGKRSALHSTYIIDGVTMSLTPAEMLDGCLPGDAAGAPDRSGLEPIIDESTDPSPSSITFENGKAQEYLEKTEALLGAQRDCPMAYSASYTKGRISQALLDSIWKKGHFRLADLGLDGRWRWDSRKIGNMAAFYDSAEAAADFIEGLGICLTGYSCTESAKGSGVTFKVVTAGRIDSDEDMDEGEDLHMPPATPFGSENPAIGKTRAIPDKMVPDPESWLIYIPFDSCEFRLGGSLLCKAFGQVGEAFPEIGDADYFIDCHEVVREFVEDRIATAGVTVCEGGLLTALKSMCPDGVGATLDISGILSAYGEKSATRVLFAEVPGVLVQIRDIDYDYVDAELLLQDIAYYPVGHPVPGSDKVKVKTAGGHGISGILQSLLSGQASEGED